ncbi:hypothetical protein F4779DRAFT_605454 [Xylariaceae sp. FL0662B]|nr:hypothetical protein F4779DRAFT_605454 [Xylariaceae sp. FL0662B]
MYVFLLVLHGPSGTVVAPPPQPAPGLSMCVTVRRAACSAVDGCKEVESAVDRYPIISWLIVILPDWLMGAERTATKRRARRWRRASSKIPSLLLRLILAAVPHLGTGGWMLAFDELATCRYLFR